VTKIGITSKSDGWVILVELNGIDYKSSKTYPTLEEAAVALAQAFPSMSAEMLTGIVDQAKGTK
jgi:hypothetical protein